MSNLFIPTQGPAAEAYNDLVRYYGAEDYHAHYIRTFQVILSSLLKEDFLVNDPDYKDAVAMYPLPPSNAPNPYLPQEGFLYYLMVFEKVMRKNNIIGGFDAEETRPDVTDGSTLDPLIDYLKRFRTRIARH